MNQQALSCLNSLLALPGEQKSLLLATILGSLDEEALAGLLAQARLPLPGGPGSNRSGPDSDAPAVELVTPTKNRVQTLRALLACGETLSTILDDALFQDLYADAMIDAPPPVTLFAQPDEPGDV